MSPASALSLFRHEDHSHALLNAIIDDAIRQQLLFPSARELRGFTRHGNRNQQQFSVQTDAGALFIKCQQSSYLPHFEAEQACLLRMMETQTIAVCAPLALGCTRLEDTESVSYLILQHIPLAVHGDWFSAGQQLAQMHAHTSTGQYGFECTTWCGETAQDNRWQDNWCEFFTTQRLQPLLHQLEQNGTPVARSAPLLDYSHQLLRSHQPPASLLHGDLWSGNIGFNPDRQLSYPVLYDPSCYYGDAETDLAMSELFGRFPRRFYAGYESVCKIDAGYGQRRDLYQLYHLLNHALLFGGSYLAQAGDLIDTILQPQ